MIIEDSVLKKVEDSDIVDGVLVVPDSITSIGARAVSNCTDLKEIVIPDSVTHIGENAFYECTNLRKVVIPGSVMSIGESAFFGCTNLTEVEILEGVIQISEGAFENCSNLAKVKLPEGIKDIEAGAFQGCTNLAEIEIPEGIRIIKASTFSDCHNLNKIKLPKGIKYIRVGAFQGCTNLAEIEIPENVEIIKEEVFLGCHNLNKITIPDGLEEIGMAAFKECENLTDIQISQENLDYFVANFIIDGVPLQAIFKDSYKKIEQIKSKANFQLSPDFYEADMTRLYYIMSRCIGIDEVERIVEIPNLTPDEIQAYSLEKDEAFNVLYDTKYQISGDFGMALEILKNLDLNQYKMPENTAKNTVEMKLFKALNQKLEEGYQGSLADFVSHFLQEQNLEIPSQYLEKIQNFERSLHKSQIGNILQEMNGKIAQVLGEPTDQYPEAIVPMQIAPIQAMVEDVIRNEFREQGKIEFGNLKIALEEKIASAHAPYVTQHKDQILSQVLGLLEQDETFQEGISHSSINALRNTKNAIGGAWKYKLNQTLQKMGYSFSSLPNEFSKEEMEQFSNLLGEQSIKAEPVSVLKEGADREAAYRLLAEKDLPKLVTYKQIHDMFFSVHGPYSDEFKQYFKAHREEFWENPEYYAQFGRIHNNFEEIVHDPKLRNIYEKGELSVGRIVETLKEKNFANQRAGDEELAQLASSVGTISTDEEFAGVQKVFDITKKRERTSVPPIEVTKSKFRGRMLAPDDVLNLFAGDITTCCQKFNDVGEGSMLVGSIEENAGIFVVEELDENGKPTNIIGQSLTIRQKGKSGGYDRLDFDNIEITDGVKTRLSKEEEAEILEIYKQAGREAIEKDKKFLQKQVKKGKITQEQYDSLVLKEVIAGTGYNDLDGLTKQPSAKIVVPDEARNTYRSIKGQTGHPWIDSAGGKAPTGSKGMPVILATMTEEELEAIQKRKQENQWKVTIKPKEVPLWYGKVGEVETLSDEAITEDKIEKIKRIERIAFREEQQLLNQCEAETPEEMMNVLVDMDDVQKFTVKLGSNEDWFAIYAENQNAIEISCLAAVSGIRAEHNGEIPKANAKLATAESANELYGILLEATKNEKQIFCDATADTSLINLKNMLRKGLIQMKDLNGTNILYKDKELLYEDTEETVELRDWDEESDITMLRLEIIPDVEKIQQEKEKFENFLAKMRETVQMEGKAKEPGLDEMRNQIREEWQGTNDEK